MSAEPLEIFRQEAEELFAQLETALLDLESAPQDKETVASAFRALHTIKGSGAMFGFEAAAQFTHHVETVFDRVRNGEVTVTPGLIGVTLAAKDHMRRLIEAPETAAPGAGDAILADLRRVVSTGPDLPAMAAPVAPAATPEPAAAAGFRIRFALPGNALVLGTNPVLMIRELLEMGQGQVRGDASALPPLDAMDPEHCYLRWEVTVATPQPVDAVEDVFMFVRDETDLSIEPLDGPAVPPEAEDRAAAAHHTFPAKDVSTETEVESASEVEATAAAQARAVSDKPSPMPAAKAAASPAGVVKVNADRIDSLMNQVGELVIAQSRLKQIAHSGEELSLQSLRAIAEEMERLVSELRDTTMGIRMVPIGSLFGRFRRVVRDLSQELGKDVQLVTQGEETELDKTVVESLNDPLVHLIRNAVDHGIESTAERLAAGKPAEGSVLLTAAHVGGQVLITVSDDGKGLDRTRIRTKAEERGLIPAGADLTEADIFDLIFHPGFSTARAITNVSGRGVGLDVVKKTIDGLRGIIEVSSRPGQGSRMALRLPLTLAIIDGLMVRIGEGRYIVPLSAVDEIVALEDADNGQPTANNFLYIRDELVPFLRLREVFAISGKPPPYEKVVIVSAGERRVGLVVDQMLGDHQTVIKSLSRLHVDVKCFSGATILGDGRVALILDVVHLIEYGQNREERLRST